MRTGAGRQDRPVDTDSMCLGRLDSIASKVLLESPAMEFVIPEKPEDLLEALGDAQLDCCGLTDEAFDERVEGTFLPFRYM